MASECKHKYIKTADLPTDFPPRKDYRCRKCGHEKKVLKYTPVPKSFAKKNPKTRIPHISI